MFSLPATQVPIGLLLGQVKESIKMMDEGPPHLPAHHFLGSQTVPDPSCQTEIMTCT